LGRKVHSSIRIILDTQIIDHSFTKADECFVRQRQPLAFAQKDSPTTFEFSLAQRKGAQRTFRKFLDRFYITQFNKSV